jgi:regulation of enolase protein 1 (concanavalin A-like superfamily)
MWIRYSLLALVVGLPTPIPAAEKLAPLAGWGTLSDPDSDCTIKLNKKTLTMKLPGAAHDFAGELERWNAPRVMSKVDGDFILEVKVDGKFAPTPESSIPGRRAYNGAGILLVSDKDNHLSLQRGSVNLGDKTRHYLNFELRKDAKLSISLYEVELEDKPVFLRVERRGSKVYGMGSHDGIKWQSYDPIEVNFPPALEVGVVGISSSKGLFECDLEGLSLFRKTEIKVPEK